MWRESKHYFFKLSDFEESLKTWIEDSKLHKSITNKLFEWFEMGLQDWDISRDDPYLDLKSQEKKKYFYVWLDAPIGYLASFLNFCKKNKIKYSDYFDAESKAELYHFIGKDIVYFHALFWPAVLKGSRYKATYECFLRMDF